MNDQVSPSKDITVENGIKYFHRLEQGSEEWHNLRLGMMTASGISKLVTPTLKIANNKDVRTYVYELAAERLTGRAADHFMSYDMERGKLEEIEARIKYNQTQEHEAKECGFVINDTLGFEVGCSPDGLVGTDGTIEAKSRVAKYQMQTIMEHVYSCEGDRIPSEFMLQVQSNLWVTKRDWCDFISYSNGLNMVVIRCEPIAEYQYVITQAVIEAENKIRKVVAGVQASWNKKENRIYPVKWIDHHAEITA